MDVIYTWILWQGKNLCQFRLSQVVYQVEGEGVKGGMVDDVIHARYKVYFIGYFENLV